jgi:RHS repeat-associated protein
MSRSTPFRSAVVTASLACLLIGVPIAAAQVSPVGAHDSTVGPGAGLASPSSPTGGFAASVPLDLPGSRSGLAVPFDIRYNASTRVGAAGSGWDVPLSYVRVSQSIARRKPSVVTIPGAPLSAPRRVLVALDGAPMLMVPSTTDGTYVPFAADSYMELRQSGSDWVLELLGGTRYVFGSVSALSSGGFVDDDLWLLKRIERPGGTDRVELAYNFEPLTCGNGTGTELDLSSIKHTFDSSNTPLFEIKVSYAPWHYPDGSARCKLGTTFGLGPATTRQKIVDRVTVLARDNTAQYASQRALRTYKFTYKDDIDTGLPRLETADVFGEKDPMAPLESVASLPVIRYEYGAMSSGDRTEYSTTAFVPRSFAVPGGGDASSQYVTALSTSAQETELLEAKTSMCPWGFCDEHVKARRETTYTRHALRDFTGDGLPDLVFKWGSKWVLYPNKTNETGSRLDIGPAYTWTEPREIFQQTTFRFTDHKLGAGASPAITAIRETMVTTETWVQFLDWNGDGRMDVVDAIHGATSDSWKVWINEGLSGSEVKWRAEDVYVGDLRPTRGQQPFRSLQEEVDRVLDLAELENATGAPWDVSYGNRLSLERAKSTPRVDIVARACYRPNPYPPHDTEQVECAEQGEPASGEIDTFTQWRIVDTNGDSYPDFVIARQPVLLCEQKDEWGTGGEDLPCPRADLPEEGCEVGTEFWQYGRIGICPEWNGAEHRWVLDDIVDGSFAGPTHDVFVNVGGPLFPQTNVAGDVFRLSTARSGEVGRWVNGEGKWNYSDEGTPAWELDPGASAEIRGYSDPDGTGIPTLHDGVAQFETDRDEACGEWSNGSTPFTSRQVRGLVDLSGDGLLDFVWHDSQWHVRYGTGADTLGPTKELFAPEGFELSKSKGTCGGMAQAVSGLEDIDGDGKPELLHIEDDGKLFVERLTITNGSVSNGGRLTAIDNRVGAVTRIEYTNNKTETLTPHEVPFPEIVVSKLSTTGATGVLINPTYYAYGTARLTYDPLFANWSFLGYERVVAVTGDPKATDVHGIGFVTDRSPAAPPGSTHEDLIMSGRVVRTTRLEGALPSNPRPLLTMDVNTTPQARAGSRVDYDVIELPTNPNTVSGEDCFDADGLTGDYPIGDTKLCRRSGLVLAWNNTAWEGTAAPPATVNVWSGSYVETYDGRGRPTKIVNLGDVRRYDDDTCTLVNYAQPTTPSAALLVAPSSIFVTDCGWDHSSPTGSTQIPGAPIILAGTRFVYDALPEGQLSNGRVTSRIVERYESGNLVGQFVAEQTQYDPATALPTRVLRARSLGTSTIQTTDFVYDRYNATLARTTVSATDIDIQLTRTSTTPVWPTVAAEVTEPAGEKYSTVRDVFGRPKEFRLQPVGEQPYVQRRIEYQDNASPRSITSRSYYGSTPATSTSTDRSLFTKTYADALGRELYSTSDLGGDYANAVLVSGLRTYDSWGRVQYEAAPFQASQAFTPPPASQLPYGTTYVYDAGSRVLRVVNGPGLQPNAWATNPDQDIYPTTYEHLWSNGLAVERVRGPTEVDASSNTYGHYDETVLTGSGRSISTSRWNSSGVRIDRVQREIDRLGRLTSTRRYKDAAAGTGTVDWLMKVDSLGNVVEQSEPNMAPVKTTYDEWGAAIQSEWEASGFRHVTKWSYDGFGRLTDRVLEAIPSGQTSGTQESVEFYYYDQPSGDANQPGAAGSFVGRLSWAEAKNVSTTFYTYDTAGRQIASTVVHKDEGKAYRTRTKYSAVGHVDGLVFEFPDATGVSAIKEDIDYGFDSAARMKTVKYFDGAATSTLLAATTIDPLGRYRAVTLGNGVTETYDYQTAGRQELSKWEVHTSADWRTVSYDLFDAEMRVKKMGERTRTSLSDTTPYAFTSFAYDGVDRLTDAITMKGSTALANHHYAYDGLGNQTRSSDLLSSGKTFDLTYTSADPDRLFEQVFTGLSQTRWRFAYDGAGNVVNAQQTSGFPTQPARGFTYDAASRILAMYKGSWNAAFKYGPGGDLAIEEVKNGSMLDRRIRHYGALMEQRTRSGGTASAVERYIPGPLGAFATIRGIGAARTITYTHGDGRANRFFTQSNGSVIESAEYQPYGKIKTSTGTPSNQDYSDDLFNGGDTYAEFGVVLLGARVYDPEIGRFLQRDPFVFVPQSTKGNPYTFSLADPINYADPSGMSPWLPPAAATIYRSLTGNNSSSVPSWSGGSLVWATGVALAIATAMSHDWSSTPATRTHSAAPSPNSRSLCTACDSNPWGNARPPKFTWDGVKKGVSTFARESADALHAAVSAASLGYIPWKVRIVPLEPPPLPMGLITGNPAYSDGDLGEALGYWGPMAALAVLGPPGGSGGAIGRGAGRVIALDANAFRGIRGVRAALVQAGDRLIVTPNVVRELARHGITEAEILADGVRIATGQSTPGMSVVAGRVASELRALPGRGANSAAADALNVVEAANYGADLFVTRDRQIMDMLGGRSVLSGSDWVLDVVTW